MEIRQLEMDVQLLRRLRLGGLVQVGICILRSAIFVTKSVETALICISMNVMMEIQTITMAVMTNARLRMDGNAQVELPPQPILAGD